MNLWIIKTINKNIPKTKKNHKILSIIIKKIPKSNMIIIL